MSKFTTKTVGNLGEDYAVKYLKKHKYKIVERNYSKACGEIDIIAENKEYLAFVEVKTRNENMLFTPALAVNKGKQRRIIKTASLYLAQHKTEKFCRFDVCEVTVDSNNLKLLSINYIENAFEGDGYEAY